MFTTSGCEKCMFAKEVLKNKNYIDNCLIINSEYAENRFGFYSNGEAM